MGCLRLVPKRRYIPKNGGCQYKVNERQLPSRDKYGIKMVLADGRYFPCYAVDDCYYYAPLFLSDFVRRSKITIADRNRRVWLTEQYRTFEEL